MLNLAEELLLLALEDESGRVSPAASASLEYGLAGAVLMELVIGGRLGVEDGKLVVADASRTGDGVLGDALARITASRRARTTEHWVARLGGEGLKERLLDGLVRRGVLEEERKILWVIPHRRYPARDSGPEEQTRDRVRAAVPEGAAPDPRSAALIGLIKACDLADEVFGPDRRARERLEEIADRDLVGKAVSGTVAGVQAATQAAVTASIMAATTSASASCSASSPSCS